MTFENPAEASTLGASAGAPAAVQRPADLAARRQTADRIFRGALAFNAALTLFWVVMLATRGNAYFFTAYDVTRQRLIAVFVGILFFNVLWGFIWYGVKTLLLKYVAGFSKDERRESFSSRMRRPFDVERVRAPPFGAAHPHRRHDWPPRPVHHARGWPASSISTRRVAADPSPNFATRFLQDNLFDAVVGSWIFLAFYYSDGFLAAAFYGPQSRVMDGVLARANCLLITTLWTVFKFVMVPIGARLAAVYPPGGVRRRSSRSSGARTS